MKKKILVNDGISEEGKKRLIEYQFDVIDEHVKQKDLIKFIQKNKIIAILVRSATQVKRDIIDSCPTIKLIGRGGVGMDNIDVEYAKKKGIDVINTPNASSRSVAELVFTHLFSLVRKTYQSNRTMPLEGDSNFKELKKIYSNGQELSGKTIGILGFGKIGQEVAKIAIGIGMKVLFFDPKVKEKELELVFLHKQKITFKLKRTDYEELLKQSEIISLHIPKQNKPLITKKELKMMKKGVFLINTSRGGIIDETDLINFLQSRHINSIGLDVYENEPKIDPRLKKLNNVVLLPHIGSATIEGRVAMGEKVIINIKTVADGHTPPDLVLETLI